MTKKILSFVTAALVAAATCTNVRAEVVLNAAENVQVMRAIENVQAVALQAKAAGLTQDQTAALIVNAVQNDAQLDGGQLTTQRKILIAVAAVLIITYCGVSIWQQTPLFWNWKWSDKTDEEKKKTSPVHGITRLITSLNTDLDLTDEDLKVLDEQGDVLAAKLQKLKGSKHYASLMRKISGLEFKPLIHAASGLKDSVMQTIQASEEEPEACTARTE